MLTCYNHTIRLPNNDLTYLAFRLAVQETLSDLELSHDLDEELDPVLSKNSSDVQMWRL